jgi:hypothetical protein
MMDSRDAAHFNRDALPMSRLDALDRAAEIGMAPLAARCHAGLAIVYARMSRHDAAEDHLAHARQMYKAMGMRFWPDRRDAATTAAA